MARKKSGSIIPRNDFESVVLALKLAMTAPNDEASRKCVAIAKEAASRIHPEDVSLAQKIAAQNPEDLTVLSE